MVWPVPCAPGRRAALTCGLAMLLCACGRVGIELIPSLDTVSDIDADTTRDGGPLASECEARCENPHGTASCASGLCEVSCAEGYDDCDGDPENGCETDLASATESCGACGRACTTSFGSTACVAGRCEPACVTGFGDCDGDPRNGCEADLRTPLACGTCDTVCENPNGAIACGSATCAPVCAAGYGDCDGDPTNGCETDLGGAATCPVTCELTGVYALKLVFPATWPGTLLISPGSGSFSFWGRVEVSGGTELTGSIVPCGQTVPDFSAAPLINERYGVTYPNGIFDGTPHPATATAMTLGAASPGAAFTLARTALLYGVSLASPIDSPWPSAATLLSADSDADGKRGLTALYKAGLSYNNPPANDVGLVRADRGYLASRVVFDLRGTLTSCTLSQGSASTRGLDAHTLGCRVSLSGRDCSASEANHLDDAAPRFALGTGTYTLVRVADTARCAEVRRAVP